MRIKGDSQGIAPISCLPVIVRAKRAISVAISTYANEMVSPFHIAMAVSGFSCNPRGGARSFLERGFFYRLIC